MKRTLASLLPAVLLCLATSSSLAVSPRQCTRQRVDSSLQCTETLIAMRSLQTAIEAYAIVNHRYPAAASVAALRDLVQPSFIKAAPLTDAWGTELRYLPSADGTAYRLVSAGSDRAFDEATWTAEGLLESSKEDAVFSPRGAPREWTIQE